jgi:hypothetical protein
MVVCAFIYAGSINRKIWIQTNQGKNTRPYSKIIERPKGMAQVVREPASKHQAPSSNPKK